MRESFKDKMLFNIAADCEVNSYIPKKDLPEGCVHYSNFKTLKNLSQEFIFQNLIIIQPSDLIGDYFL